MSCMQQHSQNIKCCSYSPPIRFPILKPRNFENICTNEVSLLSFFHLTDVSAAAVTRAVELTEPVLFTVRVQAQEPSIQRLLKIVQVLRHTMVLTILRAWVVIRQSPASVQTSLIAFREKSVIVAHNLDRIVVVIIQLLPQECSASVDTLRDIVCALPIRIVGARDLHQAWCWATSVRVARRLLHGDEGEEDGVDLVFVSGLLEGPIILLAVFARFAVEGWAVDLDQRVPGEKWCFPAVSFHAGVDPVFGSMRIVRKVVWEKTAEWGVVPVRTSARSHLRSGALCIFVRSEAQIASLCQCCRGARCQQKNTFLESHVGW
jgi:hypothetical protein